MLYLSLGAPIVNRRAIFFETYFDAITDEIDFDDPLVQKIVNSVDRPITYYGKGRWEGRVIGVIGHRDLSGGSKALLCSYLWPELMYPLEWIADNCAEALDILAQEKDIHWSLHTSGFKFKDDSKIYVTDWDRTVLGSDIYREVMKSDDDWAKIMQDIQFQFDEE